MGYIHDVNLERINAHFQAAPNTYKTIKLNDKLLKELIKQPTRFFKNDLESDYIDWGLDLSAFANFEEAYHCLVLDLAELNIKAINYVLPEANNIRNIYISGGFSKNEIFVRCIADKFKDKKVYTSEFDNSSALGAALVVYNEVWKDLQPSIDLGLKECIHT